MMAQMRNIARMNGRKEMLSHFEDHQHLLGDALDPEQDRRTSEEDLQAEKEIVAVNQVRHLSACVGWECTCIIVLGLDEKRERFREGRKREEGEGRRDRNLQEE